MTSSPPTPRIAAPRICLVSASHADLHEPLCLAFLVRATHSAHRIFRDKRAGKNRDRRDVHQFIFVEKLRNVPCVLGFLLSRDQKPGPPASITGSPLTPQRSNWSQSPIGGASVPSDHLPTQTMKIVTRSSGSFAAMTGEPGRLAPQLFAASPETKNIRWGCQLMPAVV